MSKISCYESPCIVTGGSKLTGSKGNPKSTYVKDRSNGTREAVNMEKIPSMKWWKWKAGYACITYLCDSESGDMLPEKLQISKRWREGH